MDKGPWKVIAPDKGKSDWHVGSDDFAHDVWLAVSGDFEDDAQRKAYCDWLASRLNGYDELKEDAERWRRVKRLSLEISDPTLRGIVCTFLDRFSEPQWVKRG